MNYSIILYAYNRALIILADRDSLLNKRLKRLQKEWKKEFSAIKKRSTS